LRLQKGRDMELAYGRMVTRRKVSWGIYIPLILKSAMGESLHLSHCRNSLFSRGYLLEGLASGVLRRRRSRGEGKEELQEVAGQT